MRRRLIIPATLLRIALAACVLAACGLAGRAEAYVRYRYPTTQKAFFWSTSCVAVKVYLNGYTDMTLNEIAKSVAAAAHTWSPSEVTCGSGTTPTHPYLEIVPSIDVDLAATPPRAAFDSRNSVIFRTERWTMSADTGSMAKVYASNALAITSVFAKADGHIVDADMEINVSPEGIANGIQFINLDTSNGRGGFSYDLQNTLTHEFGHFIGLDHTCFIPDPFDQFKTAPLDNLGNPAPDCSDPPPSPEVLATVMFASTSPGELSKRVLSPDEILATCEIYPEASDPNQCALDVPNDGVGCTVGGSAGFATGAGALAVGLALLALRRRVRRR